MVKNARSMTMFGTEKYNFKAESYTVFSLFSNEI